MPTAPEIARAWGVSPQYVHKLIKRGLPTDSFEAAKLWREAHASQRLPTHPKRLAQIVAEEKDDDSPEARSRRKQYLENRPTSDLPKSISDDSLEGALFNAIQAAEEAYRLLSEAMIEGRDSKIGVRLSIHNKAVEARFKAEQQYRE